MASNIDIQKKCEWCGKLFIAHKTSTRCCTQASSPCRASKAQRASCKGTGEQSQVHQGEAATAKG